MKLDKNMVEGLFDTLQDTLDEVYNKAYNGLDEGVGKADDLLRAVRGTVLSYLDEDVSSSSGPSVKFTPTPSVKQMCRDIAKHRDATMNLLRPSAWNDAADNPKEMNYQAVKDVWDTLPDEYKSS